MMLKILTLVFVKILKIQKNKAKHKRDNKKNDN